MTYKSWRTPLVFAEKAAPMSLRRVLAPLLVVAGALLILSGRL
jgi:hypothetical protein